MNIKSLSLTEERWVENQIIGVLTSTGGIYISELADRVIRAIEREPPEKLPYFKDWLCPNTHATVKAVVNSLGRKGWLQTDSMLRLSLSPQK